MGCHRPLGCPFCGSWEADKEKLNSKYWICKTCGTKYLEVEFD